MNRSGVKEPNKAREKERKEFKVCRYTGRKKVRLGKLGNVTHLTEGNQKRIKR